MRRQGYTSGDAAGRRELVLRGNLVCLRWYMRLHDDKASCRACHVTTIQSSLRHPHSAPSSSLHWVPAHTWTCMHARPCASVVLLSVQATRRRRRCPLDAQVVPPPGQCSRNTTNTVCALTGAYVHPAGAARAGGHMQRPHSGRHARAPDVSLVQESHVRPVVVGSVVDHALSKRVVHDEVSKQLIGQYIQ